MLNKHTSKKLHLRLNKEKIYRLRIERGWSQEDAAEECKIYNVRQYIRLENGETERPRLSTIQCLVNGFGLRDVDELILKKDEKPLTSDYNLYLNNKKCLNNILNYKLNHNIKSSKLIVLGLDNSILKGYDFSWKLVWNYLNIDDSIRKEWIRSYLQKKINSKKWVQKKTNLFVKYKLNKSDFKEILKDVYIIEGFIDFIQYCKENKYALAIVSGGIDTVIEFMIPDYKNIFEFVTINKFVFDESGNLIDVIQTPYDFKGKIEGINAIRTNLNISKENTIFIGGGYNNIHALRAANKCISIDTKSIQLIEGFDHNITKPDLREVIQFLE